MRSKSSEQLFAHKFDIQPEGGIDSAAPAQHATFVIVEPGDRGSKRMDRYGSMGRHLENTETLLRWTKGNLKGGCATCFPAVES